MSCSREALRTTRIVVGSDRISFDVQVSDAIPRSTTTALAQQALRAHPQLAQHTCVNSGGIVFGDVIASTPIIHLLEHVAVDILVQRALAQGKKSSFTGTSEWIDAKAGHARIELSYIDDLETLAAFKQACEELLALIEVCAASV